MSKIFENVKNFVTSIPAQVKTMPANKKALIGAVATGIVGGVAIGLSKFKKTKESQENAIEAEASEVE